MAASTACVRRPSRPSHTSGAPVRRASAKLSIAFSHCEVTVSGIPSTHTSSRKQRSRAFSSGPPLDRLTAPSVPWSSSWKYQVACG